jgi:hypothetical protein
MKSYIGFLDVSGKNCLPMSSIGTEKFNYAVELGRAVSYKNIRIIAGNYGQFIIF